MQPFIPVIVSDDPPPKRRHVEVTQALAYHEVMPWQQFQTESFGQLSVVLQIDETPKHEKLAETLNDDSSDNESEDSDD